MAGVLESRTALMVALRLALLGSFEARLDSGSAVSFARKKAEALLAYLALHPGQLQARDKLAALLWGDASDERARHSLRQALVTLRQALPGAAAGSLVEEGDAVRVNPALVEVDVAMFERFAADGSPDALERAATLYRGDLLEGITIDEPSFEDWLRTERERLREAAIESFAKLLGHLTKIGATDRAVQVAVRLLGLDPAQEVVHRALMRLYTRQDRRGAALRQYQACVAALERELNVEPEAETKQLYREILQSRPQPPPRTDLPRRGPQVTSEAPLIGRAVEMTTLRDRLHDAWQARGTIGVIHGEAGIGKTRLVEALIAAANDAGGEVLLGRAYESTQVLPLGPWVDAFRAGNVVPDRVADLDLAWRTELARLFPDLGSSERQPSAAEDYVRLFEAMARAIHHLVSLRPLLIVLEDLHWADEMTLRLLVFLGRRMGDWPALIIGTFRVEELADTPVLRRTVGQLSHQPRFFSTTLAALSPDETVGLVRALMSARSEEAAVQRLGERAWRASEGNPFIVVETIRALQGRDADEMPEPLTPPRVRELIAARLERLSESGRRLAGVASVIGREFDFALLERAAGLGAAQTAEVVEELVGRRVLHVVGERLDFTHERIREVAYDAVLPPYRRRLHQATAEAIEALHGTDLAPHALALGRHYYAGEVWDAAARHLAQAGASAAVRSAHREAAACFEQAIDALRHVTASRDTTAQIIDLRFGVRQSCVPLRDHARALDHLRRAEAEAEDIADRARLGWAFVYRAHARFLSGDSRGASEAGQRGLSIAEALGDPGLQESANFYLAQVLHWIGDYRRAAELLRDNVAALEPELDRRSVESKQCVNSRMLLGWCLAEVGEFAEAVARTDDAIRMAESSDNAYWLVHGCCGAALVRLRRGAYAEAAAVAERAVELCHGRDFAALWAIPAAILGLAYARSGRVADAVPLLERAAEIASILGAPILSFLGEAQLLAGRVELASSAASRAHDLAVSREERGWQAWSLRLLGDIAGRHEPVELERGEAAYRSALTIGAELGMRPLIAHCHLGLGTLYRRAGKRSPAAEHLDAAAEMFREMGMSRWLNEAERELDLLR